MKNSRHLILPTTANFKNSLCPMQEKRSGSIYSITEKISALSKLAPYILCAILICTLQGCEFLGFQDGISSDEAVKEKKPSVAARNARKPINNNVSSVSVEKLRESVSKVEIVWIAPTESVDGFILRYGNSKDRLTQEQKLSLSQLEKFEDADRGLMYRYVLSNVAPNKPVFVSLSAYSGDVVSAPSDVVEVTP